MVWQKSVWCSAGDIAFFNFDFGDLSFAFYSIFIISHGILAVFSTSDEGKHMSLMNAAIV
jgi:hypothetical protein